MPVSRSRCLTALWHTGRSGSVALVSFDNGVMSVHGYIATVFISGYSKESITTYWLLAKRLGLMGLRLTKTQHEIIYEYGNR